MLLIQYSILLLKTTTMARQVGHCIRDERLLVEGSTLENLQVTTISASAKVRLRAQLSPTYGNAMQKHPQGEHYVCQPKARLFAWPGIWRCTVGK